MSKRVLVIEYDEQVLLYVSEVLAEEGHEVLTARSAAEGLRAIGGERPALVISTFSLPDAERQQVLDATAARDGRAAAPLLFMSTESSAKAVHKWTKAGVAAFLSKPFLPNDLLREVDRLLRAP